MENVFGILLAVSVATERFIEVLKPLYLKAKNTLLKKDDKEVTKTEKIIMSIGVAVAMCIVGGVTLPIGLTGAISSIVAGLIASLGSNVLHALLSLVVAFKDATEGIDCDV